MNAFKWKDYTNWVTLAQKCIAPQTKNLLMAAAPETFYYPDDAYSLCSLFGGEIEFEERVARFSENFFSGVDSIRAFHCTRTESPSSFIENGILVKDLDVLLKELSTLLTEHVPSLSYRDIATASRRAFSNERSKANMVFLGVDDRFLVDNCGHYLLYGCESILAVVRYLEEATGRDLAHYLKAHGEPTVVEVDMPIDKLAAPCRSELALDILYTYAYNTFHKKTEARQLDFGIKLGGSVPREWIQRIYHPTNIRDPFGNAS